MDPSLTGHRSRPVMSHLLRFLPCLCTEIKAWGPSLRDGKNAQFTEAQVIILLRTILADMTTTLDRGPVSETVYTHSFSPSVQPTTSRAPIADGHPRLSADGRSQLMRRRETACKLGLLGRGREESAQPWPGSGGGGRLHRATRTL